MSQAGRLGLLNSGYATFERAAVFGEKGLLRLWDGLSCLSTRACGCPGSVEVAEAPGVRVPGPPEKEQVQGRAISPEASVGQTGWI